jgi:hypothetical protein
MQFIEMPLDDVGDYLEEILGIPVVVDESVSDTPMNLSLEDVSFAAATQGLEDTCPQIRFVVRDYGILVTSSEFAARAGFISVSDIGKHLAGQPHRKKPESKPEPKREGPQ